MRMVILYRVSINPRRPITAAALLSSARRYRAISGRALARRTGSSQAGLVELESGGSDATVERLDRLLGALDFQIAVLPSRLGTAASAGEEARRFLRSANRDAALRVVLQLVADLRTADPALRVALCTMPPATTDDAGFDALLAGVVEYVLLAGGLPLPAWISEESRVLDVPWDVEPVPSLRVAARRRTPAAIRRHGVYVDHRELVNS